MRALALPFVALAISNTPVSRADEKPERSPEIEVLERFAGTWDLKMTLTNPGQEPFEAESVSFRRMSKGGKVLIFDEPGEGTEVHLSLAYDPDSKEYRGVILLGLERGAVTGTWDAGSNTMRFEIEYANGYTYKGKHAFKRDGYAEASGKVWDPDGNLAHTIAWKQTRRAEK